ncbi:MAG: hypothetical protein GY949_17155, partial [Gammaproteobacteria bacterium]|nr:hypothetical protein [Gammaproteobacteria bacterium]
MNRTSESTANQQRAVAAAFREVQEEAGKKLIPALNTLLEIGTDALPLFATVMGEIVELLAGFIEGMSIAIDLAGNIPGPLIAATSAAAGLKVALIALSAHPVLGALALVAGAVALIGKEATETEGRVASVLTQIVELDGALSQATVAEFIGDDDLQRFEDAGVSLEDITAAVVEGGDAFLDIGGKLDDAQTAMDFVRGTTTRLKNRMIELRTAVLDTGPALRQQELDALNAEGAIWGEARAAGMAASENARMASTADLAAAAQASLTAALQEYVDTQLAAINPVLGQIKATEDLATAQAALAETELEFGAGSDAAVDASLAVISAQAELDEANAKVIASGVDATETFRELGNRAELSGVQLQG